MDGDRCAHDFVQWCGKAGDPRYIYELRCAACRALMGGECYCPSSVAPFRRPTVTYQSTGGPSGLTFGGGLFAPKGGGG